MNSSNVVWNVILSIVVLMIVIIILILLSGCQFRRTETGGTPPVSAHKRNAERTIFINGQERSYLLHIPSSYDGNTAWPLVIVLHGGGLNAENAVKMTGMSEKADLERFIVAYPNGSGRLSRALTWNAGACCGYAMEQGFDDVAFIKNLVMNLKQELNINPSQIYVTGASNGAMMAYRLGCELSDVFAAIGLVAGYMAYQPCRPAHPLSVIIFHGTADEFVPYEGGLPSKRAEMHTGPIPAVADAVSFWMEHNQCTSISDKQENGSVIRQTYASNCILNTEVILYTILGGGHAWPGGEKGTIRGDEPTQDISATDLIWDFFKQHPKSQP